MKRVVLFLILVAGRMSLFAIDPLTVTPDGHILINANGVSIDLVEYLVPVGSILPFAGTTPPAGWALCDGASVPRVGTYERLFSVIGTAFGSADGASFNLPDLRGRFLRGVDGNAGVDPDKTARTPPKGGGNAGNNVGSQQSDAVVIHGHVQNFQVGDKGYIGNFAGGPNPFWYNILIGNAPPSQYGSGVTPKVSNGETRPTNIYVNFMVKI